MTLPTEEKTETAEPKKEARRLLPRIRTPEERRVVYYIARYLLRIFYSLVGNFRVIGDLNVPKTGPVILAANHISHLDPPLLGCCLPRTLWFMAKEELFYPRFLGNLMPYLLAFPVRRGTADRAALKRTFDLLAKGEVVVIFPEGQRSKNGRLQPGEPGIAMIALRSRATVIPVGIRGTFECLPPSAKMLKRGRITVQFGEPLDLSDLYDRRNAMEECIERIMAGIAGVLGVPPPPSKRSDSDEL